MTDQKPARNNQQEVFRKMVLGTLLYSVVLGFFNDYTDILHTGSYSVAFSVAILMQVLTYLTFLVKDQVVMWISRHERKRNRLSIAFGIWLVMFLSKFVFLVAIDFVFGGAVEISGFIGLILIIICMTVVQQLIELAYDKLGD